MKFPTHAVLSVTTGVLLGDIGGVYQVVSHLVGRDVYTHELPMYGRPGAIAIIAALPELPDATAAQHVNGENYKSELAAWVSKFGDEIDLPDALRECLADDRSPMDTLAQVAPHAKIITLRT